MSAQIQFAFPIAIAKNNKQYNFKFCKEKLDAFNDTLFQAITQAMHAENFTHETFNQMVQETIKLTYISSAPKDKQEKPKKPVYGFMAYCMEHRAEVKEKHPDLKSNEINAVLGPMWKKLSDEEKAKYAAPTAPAHAFKASAPKDKKQPKPSIIDESKEEQKQPEPEPQVKQEKQPKAKKEKKEAKPKEAKLTKTYEKDFITLVCHEYNKAIASIADEDQRTLLSTLFMAASKKAKGSIATLWEELGELKEHPKWNTLLKLFEAPEKTKNSNWAGVINFIQNDFYNALEMCIALQVDEHIEEIKEDKNNDLRYYHIVGLIDRLRWMGYMGKDIDGFLEAQ